MSFIGVVKRLEVVMDEVFVSTYFQTINLRNKLELKLCIQNTAATHVNKIQYTFFFLWAIQDSLKISDHYQHHQLYNPNDDDSEESFTGK